MLKKTFSSKKSLIANILLYTGLALVLLTILPYVYQEIHYRFLLYRGQKYVVSDDADGTLGGSVFGQIMSNSTITINPTNREFSLVVEKIGLNVPVIMGVSVTDENKYKEALKNGVAHAITSDLPSEQPGNVYIFAHASLGFWSLGRYATSFNLLRKLQEGDEINVFYRDKRYVYSVLNKEVVPGWNTYPLTRSVIEPILTLQTCDPPGTTLNRMIVTAKLKRVI